MSVTVGLADSSLENWQNLCVLTEHIYAERWRPPLRDTGEHKPTAFCRNGPEKKVKHKKVKHCVRPRAGNGRLQPAKRVSAAWRLEGLVTKAA